jgi:hypothetical protein
MLNMTKQVIIMKKRFNKDAFLLATFILFSLSLCALFAMTLPGVELSYFENKIKIDGLFAVFGGQYKAEDRIGLVTYFLDFNLISLLGYSLPIIGSVVGIFAFRKANKILYFISGILCLIGGVLIFLEPMFFIYANNYPNTHHAALLVGPIIGGITSSLAGLIGIGCGIKINRQ